MATTLNMQKIEFDKEPKVLLSDVADAIRNLNDSEQEFGTLKVRAGNKSSIIVTSDRLGPDFKLSVTGSNTLLQRGNLETEQEKAIGQKLIDRVSEIIEDHIKERDKEQKLVESGISLGGVNSSTLIWAALNDLNAKRNENGEFDFKDAFDRAPFVAEFKDEFGREYATFTAGVRNTKDSTLDNPKVEPFLQVRFGESYGGRLSEGKNGEILNTEGPSLDISGKMLMKALDLTDEGKWYATNITDLVNSRLTMSILPEERREELGVQKTLDNLTIDVRETGEKVKAESIPLDYKIDINGRRMASSKDRDLYRADDHFSKSWENLRDKLVEFREGPVQECMDMASSFRKAVAEIPSDIKDLKPYQFDVSRVPGRLDFEVEMNSKALDSFKEGWNRYNDMKAVKDIAENGDPSLPEDGSRFASMEAGMRYNEMRRLQSDLNNYEKAAIALHENVDRAIRILDSVGMQIGKGYNAMINSSVMQGIRQELNKCLSGIVSAYQSVCKVTGRVTDNRLAGELKETNGHLLAPKMRSWSPKAMDNIKDVLHDAKVTTDTISYTNDRIAELLNDTIVTQKFQGISSGEFVANIDKAFCWKELNSMFYTYEEAKAKDIDKLEPRDKMALMKGPAIVRQKDQIERTANAVRGDLERIMKEDITKEAAIDRLSRTIYDQMQNYDAYSGSHAEFDDLSAYGKDVVKDIADKVLNELPAVSEKMERAEVGNQTRENEKAPREAER